MLPRLLRLSLLCGSILLLGCRSNSKRDLVEAELRTKDRQLREMQEQLDRATILNQSILTAENGVPAPSGISTFIRSIELGTGSGGLNTDGQPGDEILVLMLVPRDEEGHPAKAPGNLAVLAQEITPEGTKVPLSNWDISPAQLRPLWHQGVLSSSYQLKLGLKRPASFEKIRVTVQLTLPDGRILETDKDLRIHPNPSAVPTLPAPAPTPEGPILSGRRAELMSPVAKPRVKSATD